MNESPGRASALQSVVVTGLGAVTPVGAQAVQTITSVRAGVARMTEFGAFEPPVSDPARNFPEALIVGRVAGLADDLPHIQRLLAMASNALAEALEDAGALNLAGLGRLQLMVFGGDAVTTRVGTVIAETLAPRLARRMSGPRAERVVYADTGAAGFLRGLATAAQSLLAGNCDTVVLGAVDSLLATETLTALAGSSRLKTAENPVGLIPGEGAAFVVLELETHAQQRGATAYARLGGVTSSVEPDPKGARGACDGGALASCLQDVLAQMVAAGIAPAATYCNLNGEPRATEEWGYACHRLLAAGQALPKALVHPADCMGDVGSAMAGVLTCLGAHSLRHGKAGWAPALIWCGSDSGTRTAAYLEPV